MRRPNPRGGMAAPVSVTIFVTQVRPPNGAVPANLPLHSFTILYISLQSPDCYPGESVKDSHHRWQSRPR